MRQFEIWWADLREPVGRCPVLLLSRDDAYTYLNKFIVAEITTTIRDIASEVLLGEAEGMPEPCVVNCDNLRMVPRERLTRLAGRLPLGRWIEVKRSLGAALGWRELTDLDC